MLDLHTYVPIYNIIEGSCIKFYISPRSTSSPKLSKYTLRILQCYWNRTQVFRKLNFAKIIDMHTENYRIFGVARRSNGDQLSAITELASQLLSLDSIGLHEEHEHHFRKCNRFTSGEPNRVWLVGWRTKRVQPLQTELNAQTNFQPFSITNHVYIFYTQTDICMYIGWMHQRSVPCNMHICILIY